MPSLTRQNKIRFLIYSVKFFITKPKQFPLAVRNLFKAVYNYHKHGHKLVTDSEYEQRQLKCQHCPSVKFNFQDLTCEECGCFVPLKALFPLEQCPFLYWPILETAAGDINNVIAIMDLEHLARTRRKKESPHG